MVYIFIERRNLDTKNNTGKTSFEHKDSHQQAKERGLEQILP
jgi:hypothetical protein